MMFKTLQPLTSADLRECAETARTRAAELGDPADKASMLSIARMYDEMAGRAAKRESVTRKTGKRPRTA
jgi:hypothetical protein